jgi:hypothetical protein
MRSIATIALALAGCVASHSSNAVDVARDNCSTCHLNDRNASTRQSVHAQNNVDPNASTCSDCHRISDTGAGAADWAPALLPGTHAEGSFEIQIGPHAQVLCADCHVAAINKDSTIYPPMNDPNHDTPTNVVCVGCHSGVHALDVMASVQGHVQQQQMYATAMTARGSELFCRTCHPLGRR